MLADNRGHASQACTIHYLGTAAVVYNCDRSMSRELSALGHG
ncbi:hypothetical protein [Plectonema radiosum]|nr:hypothetical protein [Plectonema radiosum]